MGGNYKHGALLDLIEAINGTKLTDEFYTHIEQIFLDLFSSYDVYSYDFHELVNKIKGTKLMDNNFSFIGERFLVLLDEITIKYFREDRYRVFTKLIESIKDTKLMDDHYHLIKAKFFELLDYLGQEYWFYVKGQEVRYFHDMLQSIKGTKLMRKIFAGIIDIDLVNHYTIKYLKEDYLE